MNSTPSIEFHNFSNDNPISSPDLIPNDLNNFINIYYENIHKMDTTMRTKHVLDYLVGESRRDIAISIGQVILYILGLGIMVLVLYLLMRKVLPVTNAVLPLVSTKLVPTVHSAEPIITDVIETIHDETHKPTEQLSKIVQDIVWNTQKPHRSTLTPIGNTINTVETIAGNVQEILTILHRKK